MDKETGSEYPVGYKKPPRHTQFKPGQSGNAKGRPKKDKPIAEVFRKELRRTVVASVGRKKQRISMLEAIVKQQVSKAATGDPKATALVLEIVQPAMDDKGNHLPELLHALREKNAQNIDFEQKQQNAAGEDGTTPGLSPADAIKDGL